VAFDLDLEAAPAARFWAERNGLADRLSVLTGPIEAIRSAPFDWLFANLLKCELLPLAEQVAGFTRRGGRAIFSGMLAKEREEVESALARVGFTTQGVRTLRDATGDEWMSLLMLRG
jgi:ribosomal protein L11 methyltransferase